MDNIVGLIVLSTGLFVSTNLDDLFILVGFLANPRFQPRQVVLGQLAGISALCVASVVLSLISLVIPSAWIGFLGLLPIAIGLKELWELWKSEAEKDDDPTTDTTARGNVLTVAVMTVANGGDNLSIYTPVFATRSFSDVILIGLVFAAMTLVWVGAAFWLTRHRTLGAPIRRYGRRVTPFVLGALGAWILHEAGSVALARSWL